ncbi:MAG: AAA family ATPase [Planctomycetia bacterium]|nr:AAA family ATPase [Planctomycetia bacterium]
MRINEIRVDSYGELSDRRFDFSSGNFHLIYGPNEAGKSTFLELVRDLMFGFSQQGKYQFSLLGRPSLSASLLFALDNEQTGFLSRKLNLHSSKRESEFKAAFQNNENSFFKTAESSNITESEYKSLLGNAGRQLFCHFFGFSYQELAEGELLLKNSGLSDLIYGTGLGGLAAFQSLKNNLKKEIDLFFKKSGNAKNPKINKIILDLNNVNNKIKTESIDYNEYNNVRLRKIDIEKDYLIIKEKRDQFRKEREYWEQLENAYQLFEEFQQCQNLYSTFLESVPFSEEQFSQFPINGIIEVDQIQQSIQENRDELLIMENESKEIQTKLDKIDRFPFILKEAKEIQRLDKRLEEIQNIQLGLPTLKAKFESDQKNFQSRLEKTGILMTEEVLEHFMILPQKKTIIRQLLEEEKNKQESEKKINHYIQNKKEEKAKIDQQIRLLVKNKNFVINDEKIEEIQNQLETILQKESYYPPLFKQLQQIELKRTKIAKDNDKLFLSLKNCLANDLSQEQLAAQIVPLDSQIQEYEKEFASLDIELENNLSEIQNLKKKKGQLTRRLYEIDPEKKLPLFQHCEEKRRQRDLIWNQLKNQIETNQQNPKLIQNYELIIQELDEIIEIYISKSKEIAEIRFLSREIDFIENEIALLENEKKTILKKRNNLQSDWKQLWFAVHLDINDSNISIMKEWLVLFKEWKEKNEELSQLHMEWSSLFHEIVQYEKICQKTVLLLENKETSFLNETNDLFDHKDHISLNLNKIRYYSKQINDYQSEKNRLQLRFDEIESDLLNFQSQLLNINIQKQNWFLQFQNILNDLNLPKEWTSETFNETVLAIGQLQKEQQYIKENRLTIESQCSKIASFENDVCCLTARMNWDQNQSTENIVSKLVAALETAKKNEELYIRLSDKQKQLQETIQQKKLLLKSKEERCQQLFQSVKISTLSDFLKLGQYYQTYSEKQQSLQNSRLSLDSVLRTSIQKKTESMKINDYCQIFKDLNLEEIVLNRQKTVQQEVELDQDLKSLLTELGELSQKLKSYEKTQGASCFLVEKEKLLNELKSAINQYIPRLIAFNLLESSQKKYENEREPKVLSDASSFFSKLTSGRYTKIIRSQIADSFEVCQKDDLYKKPDQLSSGTKEQLYLAIRLAHIQTYCQHSESLPLIIDDILINFDGNRSEATLNVLNEIASNGQQIIYLTCHQSMKKLFEKYYPDNQIIEMRERNPV